MFLCFTVMRTPQFLAALAILSTATSHAALVWTGAGDAISLYQEANWLDDNNAVPGNGTINPGTAVTAATGGSILITSGSGSPSNFGGSFTLGTNDLTVGGTKVLGSSSGGGVTGGGSSSLTADNGSVRTGTLSGFDTILVDNAGEIDLVGSAGIDGAGGLTLTIQNGSSVSTQFTTSTTISVDASSSIEFLGGGNPINNSTVDLTTGGSLLLVSEAELNEHIAANKISVNGTQVTAANRDSLLRVTGGQALAIPEPSTVAVLGALAGLLLFRRR